MMANFDIRFSITGWISVCAKGDKQAYDEAGEELDYMIDMSPHQITSYNIELLACELNEPEREEDR